MDNLSQYLQKQAGDSASPNTTTPKVPAQAPSGIQGFDSSKGGDRYDMAAAAGGAGLLGILGWLFTGSWKGGLAGGLVGALLGVLGKRMGWDQGYVKSTTDKVVETATGAVMKNPVMSPEKTKAQEGMAKKYTVEANKKMAPEGMAQKYSVPNSKQQAQAGMEQKYNAEAQKGKDMALAKDITAQATNGYVTSPMQYDAAMSNRIRNSVPPAQVASTMAQGGAMTAGKNAQVVPPEQESAPNYMPEAPTEVDAPKAPAGQTAQIELPDTSTMPESTVNLPSLDEPRGTMDTQNMGDKLNSGMPQLEVSKYKTPREKFA